MDNKVYDEITKHVGALQMSSLRLTLQELIKLGYITELNSAEFILGVCDMYLDEVTVKHSTKGLEHSYGK